MHLQADETSVGVFALLPATKSLVRICGIGGELGGGPSIEHDLVRAIRDRNLKGVPGTLSQTLRIGVVLLAGLGTERLHFVNRARAIEEHPVDLVLPGVPAS